MIQFAQAVFKLTSLSVMLLTVSACWGDKAAQTLPQTAYAKPTNWVTECAGRWLVDVPTPIDFGVAKDEFDIEESGSFMIGGDQRQFHIGSMQLAGVDVLEYLPAPRKQLFDDYKRIANLAYPRLFEANYGNSDEEKAWFKKTSKQLTITDPEALARHGSNFYDVLFYRDEDSRARRFRGRVDNAKINVRIDAIAAQKTAAQAQLVVDQVLPRYRVRKSGEIPTEAGICTPYGFFTDPKGSTEQDYFFNMPLRDARYNNLVLSLEIGTRPTLKPATQDDTAEALKIEDIPTPWEEEDKRSKKAKADCRPQQGTASRDLFGCTFAGTKVIKNHRDVEYLTLSNGQKARILVVEYATGEFSGSLPYVVTLETAGTPLSATEPRIIINARAKAANSEEDTFKGKNPPSIDTTVALVRSLSQSLRLRPGAVAANVPVKDTLQVTR